MSEPKEHIGIIEDEMHKMGADGHLNAFEVSVAAGAVECEVKRLAEKIKDAKEWESL